MLLLQPDVDVNFITTIDSGDENSAISCSCHPEMTQILLRAGANPNQILKMSSGRTTNVLQRALLFSATPFFSENIRVLIESGARLLPSKEGSSDAISTLISRKDSPPGTPEELSWVSPEVFDMIIQLAKHQKLNLVYRQPGEDFSRPLLQVAMSHSAPIWMLQKILALDPQAIHASVKSNGVEMSVFSSVLQHVQQPKNHPYAMVLLEFLLENGADLESCYLINEERAKFLSKAETSSFRILRQNLENYPALKSKFVEIIIKKHGEQYFNKLEEEYRKMSK
jgi:hypothetical protein